MIASWLSNNVPKLSTILCSAGMMVPWLLPNRVMADAMWVVQSVSSSTGYEYDSPGGAIAACYAWLRWDCSSSYGGSLQGTYGSVYKRGTAYRATCMAGCGFNDDNHEVHWHPPETVPGLPGNLAAVDCDCGNCEDGCGS